MARRKRRVRQRTFDLLRWGGAREGAGRKRKPGAGMPHDKRPELPRPLPVHVTLRLEEGLGSLRESKAFAAVRKAFAGGREKSGFRLVHYGVMGNHIHLVVEADDRSSLAEGIRALNIRLARGLNKVWQRMGRVFADRYHDHVLETPKEVRNALCYVLNNARKHDLRIAPGMPDPFSSGDTFDGWIQGQGDAEPSSRGLVARATTWLLRKGWRRHGLLNLDEVPGAARGSGRRRPSAGRG